MTPVSLPSFAGAHFQLGVSPLQARLPSPGESQQPCSGNPADRAWRRWVVKAMAAAGLPLIFPEASLLYQGNWGQEGKRR